MLKMYDYLVRFYPNLSQIELKFQIYVWETTQQDKPPISTPYTAYIPFCDERYLVNSA